MIDSEIIDGELMGVIEPKSRAHQVLLTVAGIIMMRKLTNKIQRRILISDQDFKRLLRDAQIKVSESELEILTRYGLICRDFYFESIDDIQFRITHDIDDPEFPNTTVVWSLGKYTSEVLNILKDGDDAFVYLV